MDLNSMQNKMQIKKLGKEHIDLYNELLRYAFQVTEEELVKVGWEDDEIKQSKFPVLEHADVIGWFDGDKLASQLTVYPMQINIQGTIYKMGGVTGVATYPEYAGMGLMSILMKKSLEDMRLRGQTISFLYPYSIPFYRHRGWEIVSDKMTFKIRDDQLPKKKDVPGMVDRVPRDSEELITLHNRFAQKTHGCLIRNSLEWDEYWRWDVDDEIVAIYYNANREPLGYLIYLLENDVFLMKEMIYMNEEARVGLWGYISAHYSMVNEVKGSNYTNHSIAFLLEDSDITETIHPYMMARIVDFQGFLSKYHFSSTKRNDSITFSISDPMLEWNNCSVTVRFSEASPPVIVEDPAAKTISADIGAITALLMGYKRPTYLNRIERISANAETLGLLEDIIPKEKAYFSDYF